MFNIAFLGLGAMGSRMAANLLRAGHSVTVWNRDPSKAEPLGREGATIAVTPRAAAIGASYVISMVRDDDASKYVWLDHEAGARGGLSPDSIAIESSTLTPAWVRRLSNELSRHAVPLLDAPVSGSRQQAETARLIFIVGGAPEVLARAEPVLREMGEATHHAGPTGSGAAVKLATNALFGIQVSAVAEIIGMLRASGVDVARATEIIGGTPVMSAVAKAAATSMLAESFAPMFPVELAEKDLSYVASVASSCEQPAPKSNAARLVMRDAITRGYGDEHITGIARLYR